MESVMHELGIVTGIFDMLEEIMQEQKLTEIAKVNITVGELSGVLPDYFRECWNAVRQNSVFENTELGLTPLPAVARCVCGAEYEMMKNSRICPVCRKTDYEIISGKEFSIDSIEAK